MKRLLGVLTIIGGLTVTSFGFAGDGVGVGNGDPDTREIYIQKLKDEMAESFTSGGRRTPKYHADSISSWCSTVSAVLRRELGRASNALKRNQIGKAELTLVDALVAAAQSIEFDPELGGPMTKTLIDRGLLISDAMDEMLGGRCCSKKTKVERLTKVKFLVEYVKFIVRTERELDRSWYIPARYRHNSCWTECDADGYGRCWTECAPEFDFDGFQKQFIEFAQEQLAFMTTHFTETVKRGRNDRVVPIGDPRAFLKLAELGSQFVADDLRNNVYAYHNACSIIDLEALALELNAYNVFGDRSIWYNEREAIEDTQTRLQDVLSALGGCYSSTQVDTNDRRN